MKVCIDARSLRSTATGLGRYALNLVTQLALLDKENEYVIIRRPSTWGPIVQQENFSEIFLPYDISSVKNILYGARSINAIEADIYHSLFHFLPLGVRAPKTIITLHDLIWVDHSKFSDGRKWRQWVKGTLGSKEICRAIRTADHIVAVSDSTRLAAMVSQAVPTSKLTVIYHGVEPVFFEPVTIDPPAVCKGKRFIFALGNSLPYKNISRLIRAFARVAAEEKDLQLLLAGRGEGYRDLTRLVSDLDLTERVHFSGLISDEQVRSCFSHALFFAFPSLVEGFGLPLLEAMASGCPVLTSRVSSPAEIVGDTAVLIDPCDVAAIADGMLHLSRDKVYRKRLAKDGRRRAALFTWKQCAAKTLRLYQNLNNEGGHNA